MSSYQVIAKRFRPQKFSDVFEQNAIVQTIKNAIRLKKVGHAYLFSGTRGTGKTTLARLFAKALNCESLTAEFEPCNSCPSCTEISAGNSLDVIEIDGASNRGIDDIRNLNETVGYAPSNGRYKVYIIDEVHMLTKEAFNALLKTLEEPPKHVIFFFATTEPHKVLPTILSRCQRFDLRRISSLKIEEKLTSIVNALQVKVEKEALKLIASHSEGSLRDAESLLDQLLCYEEPPITYEHATKNLGVVSKDILFRIDEAVKTSDYSKAFAISEMVYNSGCNLQYFLETLANHYRAIALAQMGEAKTSKEYQTQASYYTKHHVLTILDQLIDQIEKGQKTPFKRIHLEVTLLNIIRAKKKIELDSLVERLENLRNSAGNPAPIMEAAPIKEKPVEAIDEPIEKEEPLPHESAPLEMTPPQEEVVAPLEKKAPMPPKEPVQDLEEKTPQEEPPPPAPEKKSASFQPPPDIQQKIRHDQVLRFASVELNGSIKQ